MRHFILATALFSAVSVAPVSANESGANASAADPNQAMKCRKVEVTGSLVKKGKVCKTVAEWKAIQDNGNRTARAVVESGRMCSGGDCGNGN